MSVDTDGRIFMPRRGELSDGPVVTGYFPQDPFEVARTHPWTLHGVAWPEEIQKLKTGLGDRFAELDAIVLAGTGHRIGWILE